MQALGRRLAGPDAAGRAAPAAAIVRRQPNVRLFYPPIFLCTSRRAGPMTGSWAEWPAAWESTPTPCGVGLPTRGRPRST